MDFPGHFASVAIASADDSFDPDACQSYSNDNWAAYQQGVWVGGGG